MDKIIERLAKDSAGGLNNDTTTFERAEHMRVNQQQAEQLKKAGYVTMYMTDISGNRFGKEEDYYPTLVQVVDWLREHKGLHVAVEPDMSTEIHWGYTMFRLVGKYWMHMRDISVGGFVDHNTAISAAIDKALTILLTGNELPINKGL
jgi:hypothetical protein